VGDRTNLGYKRNELINLFLQKYKDGRIPTVIHFRHILEAHDILKKQDRLSDFKTAARRFLQEPNSTIGQLFDPLVAEDKKTTSLEELCRDFLSGLKKLRIAHAFRRRKAVRRALESVLSAVQAEIDSLGPED
jgi:hypothetical protein